MLAGIASEESLLFHDLTKFHVEFLQRARNSQANRLCLSGQSAAMRQDQQIEFPSNRTYEITGNQAVPGGAAVDFAGLARAAGFAVVHDFDDAHRSSTCSAQELR